MNQDYDLKAAKEAFVSGLEGTSKQEVFMLVMALPLCIIISQHVVSIARPSPSFRFLLELLLIAAPQVLLCTAALPLAPALAALTAAAAACCATRVRRLVGRPPTLAGAGGSQACEAAAVDALAGPRKSWITSFRAGLLLYTCIAILAVDFRAFPRRYAKTEVYGTGLMDVGVGGVMLAAGLVSREANGAAGGGRGEPIRRRAAAGLRSAAGCWALGLGRLAATRAAGYQEHVGEYGVHWNFFHTIAGVALLTRVLAAPPGRLLAAAAALTAAHQAALTLGGLGAWALSPERGPGAWAANKEGLASLPGYWALALWGAAMAQAAHAALPRRLLEGALKARGAAAAASGRGVGGGAAERGGGGGGGAGLLAAAARWVGWLAAADGALWVAAALAEARVERISRRSCNAAYVLWIAAQCGAGLLPLAAWQALGAAEEAAAAGGSEAAAAAAAVAAAATAHGGAAQCGEGGRCTGSPAHERAAVRQRADTRPARPPGAGDEAGGGCGTEPKLGTMGEGKQDSRGRGGRGVAAWQGPMVLQAINRGPLAVFLAANLLTGAVNMGMNTLQVPDWPARGVIGAYTACVCGLAVLAEARGWRLRL